MTIEDIKAITDAFYYAMFLYTALSMIEND